MQWLCINQLKMISKYVIVLSISNIINLCVYLYNFRNFGPINDIDYLKKRKSDQFQDKKR